MTWTDLTTKTAQSLHAEWCRQMREKGFHLPEEAHDQRNVEEPGYCKRCHPDLVPWVSLNPQIEAGFLATAKAVLPEIVGEAFTENAALYVKQHIAPRVERLLADEREKVRETCANAVSQRAGELRDLLKTIKESCGPGDVDAETERLRMENRAEELELVAAGIRQLDLTKLESNLAPSTEEKGNG